MPNAQNLKQTYIAVLVILIAVFAMSLQAIAMKYVSPTLTIWQITIFRSIIILSGLFPLILIGLKKGKIKILAPGWLGMRGLLMVAMNFSYYGSLPLMEMSVAATAFYTAPIFIFIMAALLLGEKINLLGIAAIVLGFLGAFIIIRPGETEFNILIILPIISAITYGIASIITRIKCRKETPLSMVVAVHISFLAVGLVAQFLISIYSEELHSVTDYNFVAGQWVPMTLEIWGVMLGLAVLNTTTHLGFAKAYRDAPASIIATWEYTYLPFVVILSFFIFDEIPDLQTILGMAIIIFSGMLILFSDSFTHFFKRLRSPSNFV